MVYFSVSCVLLLTLLFCRIRCSTSWYYLGGQKLGRWVREEPALQCFQLCIHIAKLLVVLHTRQYTCCTYILPCALCSAHTSMHTCKYALHKHAQQTIEQNWWKNRGVALLCALLSPHSRQHPPSHQCLDFHTLWVISHTHNMQVSTPLLIFLHTSRSFTHWQNVPTHSMGHQVETCQHSHPPIWSFAKWQI